MSGEHPYVRQNDLEIRELIRLVAELRERARGMERRLEMLESSVGHVDGQQRQILDQMARWKGAVPILLSAGGIAGYLVTQWGAILAFFKR